MAKTKRSSHFHKSRLCRRCSRWRTAHFFSATSVTPRDRKSTRLNSSHSSISYAVFCLKKKIHTNSSRRQARRRHGPSQVCPPFVRQTFFFNDTATTEIYTLSLHDALPI